MIFIGIQLDGVKKILKKTNERIKEQAVVLGNSLYENYNPDVTDQDKKKTAVEQHCEWSQSCIIVDVILVTRLTQKKMTWFYLHKIPW